MIALGILAFLFSVLNFFFNIFITVQVFSFVQLEELFYAGSHGMDIKGPTKCPKHIKAQVVEHKSVSFNSLSSPNIQFFLIVLILLSILVTCFIIFCVFLGKINAFSTSK